MKIWCEEGMWFGWGMCVCGHKAAVPFLDTVFHHWLFDHVGHRCAACGALETVAQVLRRWATHLDALAVIAANRRGDEG